NAFRHDKIEIERVELAHKAKKVGRSFSQILPLAQASHRSESQGAAVSSPPVGKLEIARPCMPRQQSNALILPREKSFGVIDQTQCGFGRIMRWQLSRRGNPWCSHHAGYCELR